ncbi:hypothetical protein [Nocardioides ferulae]|uniref:hypothetical protein n=1 Tax=Nocardioides ferulae TaxID=2340821 RepID=UPI0013DE0C92|nr:hypothetical protein [Nocardioides ferulae]
MDTQLQLAYGIVEERAHRYQDRALLRTAKLARERARRERRRTAALRRQAH